MNESKEVRHGWICWALGIVAGYLLCLVVSGCGPIKHYNVQVTDTYGITETVHVDGGKAVTHQVNINHADTR